MIFISYRRDRGSELARSVRSELERRGFSVFLDVEDLRSGSFNTALLSEIDASSDFILILTKGALDNCSMPNDWVRKELACALKTNTNIVPLFSRDFKWPEFDLPDEISEIKKFHGINSSHDFFAAAIDRLVLMLEGKPNRCKRPLIGLAALLLICLIVALLSYVFILQSVLDDGGDDVEVTAQTWATAVLPDGRIDSGLTYVSEPEGEAIILPLENDLVGEKVLVKWSGELELDGEIIGVSWWSGVVLEIYPEEGSLKVRYTGWSEEFDEVVTHDRVLTSQ